MFSVNRRNHDFFEKKGQTAGRIFREIAFHVNLRQEDSARGSAMGGGGAAEDGLVAGWWIKDAEEVASSFPAAAPLLRTPSWQPGFSPLVTSIIGGTLGGVAVTALGHPADTVKVRLQVSPSMTTGKSLATCCAFCHQSFPRHCNNVARESATKQDVFRVLYPAYLDTVSVYHGI